jgi:type II secretory pathway component PulF
MMSGLLMPLLPLALTVAMKPVRIPADEPVALVGAVLAAEIVFVIVTAILCVKKPTAGVFAGVALIACSLAAVAYFDDQRMDTCLAISGAWLILGVLTTLISLGSSPLRPGRPDWPRDLGRIGLAVVGSIILLGLSWLIIPPVGVIGTFFWLLVAGLVIRYFLIARQNMAMDIMSTIGAAMRQQLPLPQVLAAQAVVQRGYAGRALSAMAKLLSQGVPLGDAIRRGYGKCPGFVVAMVSAAEKIHQAPAAIDAILTFFQSKSRDDRQVKPVNPVYPVVVVGFALLVVAGAGIVVVPKLASILRDMGSSLPPITSLVLSSAPRLGVVITVLGSAFVLFVLPTYVYTCFRRRRPWDPAFWSRVGDWVKWHLPLLHWFEMNYSLFHTVSFLKLSLLAGSTVDEAIAGAGELDVNGVYRRRLTNWLDQVRQGQDVSQAAAKAGVGKSLAWAFDQRVNPGNAPAVLGMLASHYSANYGYVTGVARQILWPLVVLGLAVFVGVIVVALFAPIAALQRAMMPSGAMP